MKIRISSLNNGLNHWTEVLGAIELGFDSAIFPDRIRIELEVEKRSGKIPVTITPIATSVFLCDRCGEEFRHDISGSYSIMFIKRESPLPDEMPGDDLRTFAPGQQEIDITTEVRDALFLAIPNKMLCRSDCKGLCLNCGVNLNVSECKCNENKTEK
ncbi:MAG: DUF177 domain-containing protein [Calditrichaeota bacterium]|nr:DUF177 domain-containing protein [Calditrichota bacterium]